MKNDCIVVSNPSKDITGDESKQYDDWQEYVQAVEDGDEPKPIESKIIGRKDYKFNVDHALNNIDLSFSNYTPSDQALEFFSIITLVLGEDPEVSNSLMHYFLVDLVFNNVKREDFPYTPEVQENIRLNPKKIAIIASRMSAKSTILTAYLPIYVAITGKIPNFGNVMFMVGFGDSQKAGAKVQANTIRDFCEDSDFCRGYFEKMRFTDEECEFIRRGDGPVKKRAFMYKVKGAAGGSVRGIRYRTERPTCHEVGTIIHTDKGTMKVEDYPYNHGVWEEYGVEVRVCGVQDSERVTRDHKYWAKRLDGKASWVQASELNTDYYIGTPKESGEFIWKQVKSVEDCGIIEVVPITVENPTYNCMPKSTYITDNGMSKNCLLFDDIVKNEADASSKIIMDKLQSMIYADAENALGSKGKIIIVNTPFNKKDPIYQALESGIWTPVCLPLCEKISLGMTKKEYKASWESMHPYKKTIERYEDAYYGGRLREFNQELMLRISSEEDRMVKDGMIQKFDRSMVMRKLHAYTIVVTTDFTASNSRKGDYAGIAVWAINARDDKFLLDLSLKKMTISEQYDELFKMVRRWSRNGRILEVGIEIDGQQKTHIFALKQMMLEKSMWFNFAKQKGKSNQEGISSKAAGGNKLERFKYMMPSFDGYKMWFANELYSTPDMEEMLEELTYLTNTSINSKHDDGLDVISQLALIDYILPIDNGDDIADDENKYNGPDIWEDVEDDMDDDEDMDSTVF